MFYIKYWNHPHYLCNGINANHAIRVKKIALDMAEFVMESLQAHSRNEKVPVDMWEGNLKRRKWTPAKTWKIVMWAKSRAIDPKKDHTQQITQR